MAENNRLMDQQCQETVVSGYLIQGLLRPQAFQHPVTRLELIETHISWVILTGPYAYKIKKPVDLEFLNFTSPQARQFFCEEELRLNRRFSPALYLGLEPITGSWQNPRMGGTGQVIDVAVKMKQFDRSGLLDVLNQSGQLNDRFIRDIAEQLAALHNSFPAEYPETGAGSPEALLAAIRQNFVQIRRYPLSAGRRQTLDLVERWSLDTYSRLHRALYDRVKGGFVKECHGDLHLGNIVMTGGKFHFFDCIEFSRHFRVMDTVAELAFLSMDLKARGNPDAAQGLINHYLVYRDDYEGLALLNLYRCYYSIVRAKVALLGATSDEQQAADTHAHENFNAYLDLAAGYTETRSKFLALMYGVSGTGKSRTAATIAEQCGAVCIRSDLVRKRLQTAAPDQGCTIQKYYPRQPADPAATGLCGQRGTKLVFDCLQKVAEIIMAAGFPCVVDVSFLQKNIRTQFLALASALKIPKVIFACVADDGTVRLRIRRCESLKLDPCDTDIEVMEKQLSKAQALSAAEQALTIAIESEAPIQQKLIDGLLSSC